MEKVQSYYRDGMRVRIIDRKGGNFHHVGDIVEIREPVICLLNDANNHLGKAWDTNVWIVREADFELAELPDEFCIKQSSDPRWEDYIKWLRETTFACIDGSAHNYYGIRLSTNKTRPVCVWFVHNDVAPIPEITLDMFFSAIKQSTSRTKPSKSMETQTITTKDLGRIYGVACPKWKDTIIELEKEYRKPFADKVELPNSVVEEMFKAATTYNGVDQKKVLKEIFTEYCKGPEAFDFGESFKMDTLSEPLFIGRGIVPEELRYECLVLKKNYRMEVKEVNGNTVLQFFEKDK